MIKDKLPEILNFFDPVQLKDFENSSFLNDASSLGVRILINSVVHPILLSDHFELAIIGVGHSLNGKAEDDLNTVQCIREELYRLKMVVSDIQIADLGNLKIGKTINETMFALQEVCALLFYLKINVVIVGGSQLLTLGQFSAFKEFESRINLVHVDAKIDLSTSDDSIGDEDYLSTLIKYDASFIHNVSCVGYQSYFVSAGQINQLNDRSFECYRLGKIRNHFENIEPVLRDADLMSFDISSIRISEAPAQRDGSPNGFYADEACRISRYAGLSDRMKSFGLYGVDEKFDQNRQTAKLAAQIIWYYFEGFLNRENDFPKISLNNYLKYEVQIDEIDFPIVFYKSNRSNRWWLEVRIQKNDTEKDENIVVSCTEEDYFNACKNEIPERWWINFRKLK